MLCVKSRRAAWSVECERASELTPKDDSSRSMSCDWHAGHAGCFGATHERFEVMAAGSALVLVEGHSKVKGHKVKGSD